MITIDLSALTNLQWYVYLMAGFILGAYMHSQAIHHAIHWLIIKWFQGIIWLLQRTDPRHNASRPSVPRSIKDSRRGGVVIENSQLAEWLERNPELGVVNRN